MGKPNRGHGPLLPDSVSIGRGPCSRFSLFLLFFGLGQDALAFESGEVIDKQLAIQMVHLVLNTNREDAFGLPFEGRPPSIEGGNPDPLGALDVFADIGDGETAFFGLDGPTPFDNFRIDKANGLIPLTGDIDNGNPFGDIDLSGRKTDALGGIHGMEHVIDEFSDALVDLTDRLRPVA